MFKAWGFLIGTGLLIIFVVGGLYLLRILVGNVGPVLLPPKTGEEATKTMQVVGQDRQTQVRFGESLGFKLQVADGMEVSIFAKGVDGARDLQFSPKGVLLLSQPSKGQVVALPDRNSDGKADQVKILVSNLDQPHGLAFYKDKLFIAEETKVVRYNFDEQNLVVTKDKELFILPDGVRHSTRTLTFDNQGIMYLSVGSSCDACIENNQRFGTVLVSDSEGKTPVVFAKGLRNAVFIKLNPETKELWGSEMSRDFLGDNLPADEINIIKQNKDYGWPNCYEDRVPDKRLNPQLTEQSCLTTEIPLYKIPAHSAPLGIEFWEGDLLVAYHGSWNSSVPVGYKIVKITKEGDKYKESDFVTGFLPEKGNQVYGRPVDIELEPELVIGEAKDNNRYLYISDDKAGVVYLLGKS